MELEAIPILSIPTDYMVSQYNFTRNFETPIPSREDWKKALPVKAGEACYTDGSKILEGMDTGIYGVKTRVKIPLRLGKITMAEIVAIQRGEENYQHRRLQTKTLPFF